MKRYAVVVCENCGCEYNPKDRPICPSEGCNQETPEYAEPKDTLKSKKAPKKAVAVKDDDSKE